jgi:hypothetical protein
VSLIGTILYPPAFYLLSTTSAAAALRFKRDTTPLFFCLAYHSTQIPIVFGWLTDVQVKMVMQAAVSLALIVFYATRPQNRFLLIAALCELAMIITNIAFVISNCHQWYHWMIFGILNYIALISITISTWGKRNGRVVEQSPRISYALDHIYVRRRDS